MRRAAKRKLSKYSQRTTAVYVYVCMDRELLTVVSYGRLLCSSRPHGAYASSPRIGPSVLQARQRDSSVQGRLGRPFLRRLVLISWLSGGVAGQEISPLQGEGEGI